VPIVAIESSSLENIIGSQAERIGGVQPKFTVEVSSDGTALLPAEGGQFIVKPPWKRKHLPQNEHLSMCLARLVGIETAPCALLSQTDGTQVYVTKRFDRFDDDPSRSRHQLDFCQLLDLPQDRKYDHAASRCVQVIVESSVAVDHDLAKLFRLMVFCYWIGNGDLHLKNLSLIDRDGYRLAPAYDLACSYIFGDEKLALYVRNRQKDIPRREWLAFAAMCRLDETEAAAAIDAMVVRYDDCLAMIQRSDLPEEHRPAYLRCLAKRRRALSG
jgi:serine/threonine-protein kinase HipA